MPSAVVAALEINRAFRGWGHQFLYNAATVEALLRDAGFASFAFPRYGESAHEALRGIERHEQAADLAEAPHLVIVEGWGITEPGSGFAERSSAYRRDFSVS